MSVLTESPKIQLTTSNDENILYFFVQNLNETGSGQFISSAGQHDSVWRMDIEAHIIGILGLIPMIFYS